MQSSMIDIYETSIRKNDDGVLALSVRFLLTLPGSDPEALSADFTIEAFPVPLFGPEHAMQLGAQKLALLFRDLGEETAAIASAYAEGRIPE